MIRSYRDKRTEAIACGMAVKRMANDVQHAALRKLCQLQAAQALADLMIPPGNRLEALSGNRKGQYSIRINAQWQLCFRWEEGDAYDVEIADYH